MMSKPLKQMHTARPFTPFRLNMADGRHLDVPHPEFLGVTPGGRTVFVAKADEDFEIVDLLLVTSIQPITAGSKKRRNGN
jgi:hypothetical protein